MAGGLIQLVAYGTQDVHLTSNPQITFFKVVYRRHTNFSMESIQQTFEGVTNFGKKVSCTILREGDLVHKMYLEHSATFGASTNNGQVCNNYGHALIKEVELEIGGLTIDKHYGRWMQIWSDLTEYNPVTKILSQPTTGLPGSSDGNSLFQKITGTGRGAGQSLAGNYSQTEVTRKITIPLQFWFCKNPGLSLPLISLQYHEVKVKFEFEEELKLYSAGGVSNITSPTFDLWVDYIYLDSDERRRFSQNTQEYLIDQLQYKEFEATANTMSNFELNFNHPVKELIWQFSNSHCEKTLNHDATNDRTNGSASTIACGIGIRDGFFKLVLNGNDRFARRHSSYFTRTQILDYHTGSGGDFKDSICCYSFAINPEDNQPSGTCNFSRIDSAQLHITKGIIGSNNIGTGNEIPGGGADTTSGEITTLHIYAVNYNVLRIMSGMGGLAYSN